MKLSCPLLVIVLVLAGPAAGHADTIYYQQPGATGVQTISGTIVQETKSSVTIETEDGHKVSISRDDVFEIIRDTRPTAGQSVEADPFQAARDAALAGEHAHLDRGHDRPIRTAHNGIKAGVNIANMSVDPEEFEESGSLVSYAVGLWSSYPLNRRLSLRTEALYSVKGDAESAGGYTTSARISYIDLMALGTIGFRSGSAFQPSLFVGPCLAINVSASSKLDGGGGDVSLDVKDQVRTLEGSLVFGGGADFRVGRRTFGIEARYSKGLTNAVDESANGTARNNVIAILGSIGLQ